VALSSTTNCDPELTELPGSITRSSGPRRIPISFNKGQLGRGKWTSEYQRCHSVIYTTITYCRFKLAHRSSEGGFLQNHQNFDKFLRCPCSDNSTIAFAVAQDNFEVSVIMSCIPITSRLISRALSGLSLSALLRYPICFSGLTLSRVSISDHKSGKTISCVDLV
jgi:hypothetical protein